MIDSTVAVIEIPPAAIDDGPHVDRDGDSTHNHTGKPTKPIESGAFDNGVNPGVTAYKRIRANTFRASIAGSTMAPDPEPSTLTQY